MENAYVDNLTLSPAAALGGWQAKYTGLTVTELSDQSIVSIAAPNGGMETLSKAVTSALSLELPATGESSSAGSLRLLGLQPDQWFLITDGQTLSPVYEVEQKLNGAAHLTDQSDSWVTVQLEGPQVRAALERICPIDLHKDVFSIGSVTRTSMEHLGVIIYRTAEDSFVLLSARSSAESFKHALTVSIDNTQ